MRRYCIWIVILLFPHLLSAQQNPPATIPQGTPYDVIYSHLLYLQPDSYRPGLAAQALYGIEDSVKAVRRGIRLKQILDGLGLKVQVRALPQDSNYVDSSGLNFYVLFPKQLPEVYVERIDGKWYYSEETVEQIPALHKRVYPFGADLLINLLPKFGQTEVLGMALWQYAGLLLLLILGLLVHAVLSRILLPIVRRISKSRLYPSLVEPALFWKIARLVSVLLVLQIFKIFLPAIQLPINSAKFAFVVIRLLSTGLIVLIIFQVIEIMMRYGESFSKQTESKMDEQLMPIIRRTLQGIVLAGGLIQVLSILEVNVTTLIAGISIGGLAIALAAQDTIKNLFGSLTIFMDKPFQIGDWINFSDVDGTVEEVGFRSTRVRTFANSLVYVPNGKLADMVVNNYGLRAYRRFKTTLTITYNTPPVLIEKFVEGVRAIVANHPSVRKPGFEVHLNNMSSSSLDILVYAFFDVPTWTEELKARHQVLMAFIKLAEHLGVSFAFPTSSIHVEEFPGRQKALSGKDFKAEELDADLAEFIKNYEKGLEQEASDGENSK